MKKNISRFLKFIFILSLFSALSCFDLYNDLLENAGKKYQLSIIETISTNTRLLSIKPDGTFSPGTWSSTTGGGTPFINSFFADFNKDGNTDFITIQNSYPTHRISYSDGDGNFQQYIDIPSGGSNNDVCIDDFDGNGYPDIFIVTAAGSQDYYYLNNNGKEFIGPIYIGAVANHLSVTAADYDGDGDDDIFIGTGAAGNTELFINKFNEGGSFEQLVSWTADTHNYESFDIASVDFDRDGDIDIIEVGGSFAPYIRVWNNNGSGYFSIGWTDSSAIMQQIVTADFDGDGDIDVFTKWNPGSKFILINNGKGQFQKINHSINDEVLSAAAGDVDMDGDIDIVISSTTYLTTYKNDGNAGFSLCRTTPSLGNSKISIGSVFH